MMITEFNGHIISWNDLKYDRLDYDPEERMSLYECRGEDFEGNLYSGQAEFCCDELIGITDIYELD